MWIDVSMLRFTKDSTLNSNRYSHETYCGFVECSKDKPARAEPLYHWTGLELDRDVTLQLNYTLILP